MGGRSERANLDLVRALCALIDRQFAADPTLRERFPRSPAARGESTASLINFVRDRPGHDRRYAIDDGKLRAELGIAPRQSLDTGLALTVQWYLDNEPWWRAVMDGSYREWIRHHYGGP